MTGAYLAYLAERVRPRVFVPALVGLWVMSLWTSGTAAEAPTFTTVLACLRSLLLLTLLVFQFRLWDDLEDRERDRRSHPHRVLVRSNASPFRWLLAAVAVTGVAIAAATSRSVLAGVVSLNVLGIVAYRVIRPRVPEVVWRFPIVLAKYPAFVALTAMAIGGGSWSRLTLATLVVMTGACVFEAIHAARPSPGVAS
jgi:hypothetical protein